MNGPSVDRQHLQGPSEGVEQFIVSTTPLGLSRRDGESDELEEEAAVEVEEN